MKKTALIAFAFLLAPATLLARDIEMGRYEITGTTNFDLNWSTVEEDGNDVDTDTFTLNADAQYYFLRNVGAGAYFTYSDIEVGGQDSKLWKVGPQVSYNISYDDQLSFFVNGGVHYADWEVDQPGGGADGDGFGFRVGGGAKYFLSQAVALVGQVRYDWTDLGNNVESDTINLGFGLSVFF